MPIGVEWGRQARRLAKEVRGKVGDPITKATLGAGQGDLPDMMLDLEELPPQFHRFQLTKDGPLDNAEMAEGSFPGNTAESYREAGRISGHVREFVRPAEPVPFDDGTDIVVCTTVHLFDTPQSVSDWISNVFLKQFAEQVGRDLPHEHRIVEIERLEPQGFYDETAALRVLYDVSGEQVSSTIVDFRIGRLLGVAFVLTLGDAERLEPARQAALTLERRIVSHILG